jgi:teichoic acid transport system permease protein
MIMARIGAQVQDINKLLPFAVRVLFYTSGIFFSVDRVLAGYPELLAVLRFNPIYDFIELARGLLVDGYAVTPFLWLTASGWAVLTFVFGVLFFWKAEERYGRED